MKIDKFISYDKNLVSRARELRKIETEAEKVFWSEILKSDKLAGFKFTRQKPLGGFIVDFYCARFKLAIEIDGKVHDFQRTRDEERDNVLKEKFGIRVLRYKNEEILDSSTKVLLDLMDKIKSFPDLSLIRARNY